MNNNLPTPDDLRKSWQDLCNIYAQHLEEHKVILPKVRGYNEEPNLSGLQYFTIRTYAYCIRKQCFSPKESLFELFYPLIPLSRDFKMKCVNPDYYKSKEVDKKLISKVCRRDKPSVGEDQQVQHLKRDGLHLNSGVSSQDL